MSENSGIGENPSPIDTSRFDRQVGPAIAGDEAIIAGNLGDKTRFNQVLAAIPMHSNLRRHLTTNNPRAINAYAEHCAQTLGSSEELTIEDTFAIHVLASSQVIMQRFMILDEPDVPAGIETTINNAATYFLAQFGEHLSWQIPIEAVENGPRPSLFIEAVAPQVERIAYNYDMPTAWYKAKFRMLALELARRKHLEPLLREEPAQEVTGLKGLRRGNTELMHALNALPEHAIEPTKLIQEKRGKSWSVNDFFDIQAQIAMAEEAEGSSIRYHQWVTAKMVALEHDDASGMYRIGADPGGDGAGSALRSMENARAEGFYRTCFMEATGELYIDERGTISYGRLYQKLGKFANYELLRRELIGAYFDLIAPDEVRERVAEDNMQDPSNFIKGGKIQGNELANAFHAPRIRALKAYKPPKEDI